MQNLSLIHILRELRLARFKEEENDKVYEDLSGTILQSSTMARLLSFPTVMVTSHQGFFTREALEAISRITLENAAAFEKGETLVNEVTK